MIAPDLPAELKAALETRLHGLSRRDAAQRAGAISQAYRGGDGSGAIRTETDALAYALARMPATYAAVTASFNALREAGPDLAPQNLLDVGAGPGTASWAAAEAFPSLLSFSLLDANAALRSLALDLAHNSSRLSAMRYDQGDAAAKLADAPAADLVVASYLINELDDAARAALADLMWAKTRDTLLVVEPGTPAGTQRILDLRRRLIAQGAHVAAPCPHDAECPLAAQDWCHFTQRLPRSRVHKQLKAAELPYEDEKFIYVALSRAPPAQRRARVLTQPQTTKIAVTAKLCINEGIKIAVAPRRDKITYARFRKLNWGDALSVPEDNQRNNS
jgi:ribosomal protein RSM22 (predicted rRNA methylase)